DTEEIDGTEVVVPGTYETMDSNPASFIDIFNSVFNGMNEGAEIIFFLLIIGGSLGVLSATGALDNFLNQIITKFEGKEVYLIPILLAFFTISGATFGMSEEAIPYLIIIFFEWFFMEMSATFLIMAIVVGIIAKMNYNKIAESFTQGCSDLMVASLAVGLAYSGITILEDSNVIDSIVFGLTNLVGQFS